MSQIFLFLLSMIPGTFFLGANDILVKKILREKIPETLLVGVNFFVAGAIIFIFSSFFGKPEIKPIFWPAFAVTILLNIFGQLAWYKAFKQEDVSLIAPLRLLIPVFVLVTGFLILDETPSFLGSAGVATTILGLWLLISSQANFTGRSFIRTILSPGVLWGIAAAISFSVSFPFDKKAVINSSALFFSSAAFMAIGLTYLLLVFAIQRKRMAEMKELYKLRKVLIPLFFSLAAGGFLTIYALNFAFAAYASSVKRLESLWSVSLSGRFLKEGNVVKKLIATTIMLFGVIITLLFG